MRRSATRSNASASFVVVVCVGAVCLSLPSPRGFGGVLSVIGNDSKFAKYGGEVR